MVNCSFPCAELLCLNYFSIADLSATSVRDFLLPSIQNLLKDQDALDPAHKEALEIIMKERSGGAFEAISKVMGGAEGISKVMGAHLGIANSMTSFFGEGALRAKKESTGDQQEPSFTSPKQPSPTATAAQQQDGTRFQRIMRGGLGDILRGKRAEDSPTKPN